MLDILILGGIVLFIFLRLRSVLGRRDGHEQDFPHPRGEQLRKPASNDPDQSTQREGDDGNVIPLPGSAVRYRRAPEEQIAAHTKTGSKQAEGLKAILAVDPDFELEGFLDGARGAYEMILTAFAQGDKPQLEGLLTADVYEGFAAAIDARADQGQRSEVTIIGINETIIDDAGIEGDLAVITLTFKAEMIAVTYNEDGAVIDGHPNTVSTVTDVWSFERDVTSDSPAWLLDATD
ncbi:MAG: Tim44/TimA family putative adaptor protein [Alphaproteobacteria bacterium]